MASKPLLIGSCLLMLVVGCEQKSEKTLTVGTQAAGACDVSLDALAGTEWLYLRANPDKTETPDYKIRMKFYDEGGKTKAKYNVGSVSDMYTYNCKKNGDSEVICKEEPKIKDWCQAFAVASDTKNCTPEQLKGVDSDITDEEIKEGMAKADEIMAKFRGDAGMWERFKFQNNNLGNKLQGLLYIKVDQRACRLRITDNYMTIYNGKKIEDSNPAGTNPFVKNDQGELLWEHCSDSEDLVALESAEYPAKPDEVGHKLEWTAGSDVNWWYLGDDNRVPEEGCSYSYDVYVDGKPVEKGVAAEIVDVKKGKELRWHWVQKVPEANKMPIVVMPRFKDCAGKKDKIEVACGLVKVQ